MEINKRIPQHVQLPNIAVKIKKLRPSEILTYVTIRRYMNKDTKECYPSQNEIAEKSGLSKPTIGKAIKVLESEKLISIRKDGRKNVYKFLEANQDGFEMFSYKFLDKIDLTPQEKAAYCMQQMFMFKNKETSEGDIYMSELSMSKQLGVSQQWLNKQNHSLQDKGYLTITRDRDEITGLIQNTKHFQLSKLDQAFICILKNHDERIRNNEDDIATLKEENIKMKQEIEQLKNLMQNKYTM